MNRVILKSLALAVGLVIARQRIAPAFTRDDNISSGQTRYDQSDIRKIGAADQRVSSLLPQSTLMAASRAVFTATARRSPRDLGVGLYQIDFGQMYKHQWLEPMGPSRYARDWQRERGVRYC